MRIAGGSLSMPVEGQVAQWLAGFDAHPTTLSPSQAAKWATARERPNNHYLVGRANFRANPTAGALSDDHGQLCTSPASINAALWENKQELWGCVPSLPSAAAELVCCYFSTRTADLPAASAPTVERLLGVVLAAYGSATGIDGAPYEVFHWGAIFVASLSGQALLAAHRGFD